VRGRRARRREVAAWPTPASPGLRIVHGGVRERVFETVMRALAAGAPRRPGWRRRWPARLPVEVVIPVVAWNQDDVVPLVDWLLALPGRLARVALAVPRAAEVPSAARRRLLDHRAPPRSPPRRSRGSHAGAPPGRLRRQRRAVAVRRRRSSIASRRCGTTALRRAGQRARPRPRADRRVRARARWPTPAVASSRPTTPGSATPASTAVPGPRGGVAVAPGPRRRRGRLRAAVAVHQRRGRRRARAGAHQRPLPDGVRVLLRRSRQVGDLPRRPCSPRSTPSPRPSAITWCSRGGEPTLHPDLPRFIAHARAAGFATVEIQTNGVRAPTAPTPPALVAAGLTKATVSLHSMDPPTSDAITRMPGAFPRTVAGLHHLAELGVETQLAHVISKDNFAALPAFTAAMLDEFAGAGRHLSVCFAIAQRVSDLVPRWVLPTFTEIRPYVRAALDACDAAGVGYGGLIGQGGYPPCALDGELRYYRGVLDKIYASADADAQFAKAPQCARCDFDRRCLGVRRDYLERHGADELVPFTIAPTEAPALPPPPRDPTLVALGRRR
jgi:hypothetical protein